MWKDWRNLLVAHSNQRVVLLEAVSHVDKVQLLLCKRDFQRATFAKVQSYSSGWLGLVFLKKKANLDSWGKYFLGKKLVWMAGARISLEIRGTAWLGRVFLEKCAKLRGWDAYFS